MYTDKSGHKQSNETDFYLVALNMFLCCHNTAPVIYVMRSTLFQVNHFPGSGYITQKVDLATSGIPYIPVAFRIPSDVEKLLEYVSP
jgi:hypothetical protein